MLINKVTVTKVAQILLLLSGTLALINCSQYSTSSLGKDGQLAAKDVSQMDSEFVNGAPSLISPSPKSYSVKQPDGSLITLYLKGSACLHWEEDELGYSVLQKEKRYVYAQKNRAGELVPTDFEVGKHQPSKLGLEKHLMPKDDGLCTINNH